jgi:hypothetical protein
MFIFLGILSPLYLSMNGTEKKLICSQSALLGSGQPRSSDERLLIGLPLLGLGYGEFKKCGIKFKW